MREPSIGFRDEKEKRTEKRLKFKATRTNTPYFALKTLHRSNPATGMNYEEFARHHVAELTKWLPEGRYDPLPLLLLKPLPYL